MAFLSVSDQSGEMEAIIFPTVYKKLGPLFKQGEMLLIEGSVEERDGKLQFIINNGQEFSDFLSKRKMVTLYLKLTTGNKTPENMQKIKTVVNRYPGDINVVLYYESLKKTVPLSAEDRVNGSEKCVRELKQFLGSDNVLLN